MAPMITNMQQRIKIKTQPATWQSIMADAVSNVEELLALLRLSPENVANQYISVSNFPLRVPKAFVARMKKNDPNDPLLLQVLPIKSENQQETGYVLDPVGDLKVMPQPGLLHKYQGRALLVTTAACAIHCRYCFRRHFPYSNAHTGKESWDKTLTYLKQHPDITEIILSGGDPLSLSDQRFATVIKSLTALPQIQRIRLHTRLPIVIPERITPSLLNVLTHITQAVVVVHINHPNELDETVYVAMHQLRKAGVTLLNQAVLLRGVNDDESTLVKLSEELFRCGILPYYLHMLDPVQGAQHFAVKQSRAQALHTYLMQQLPGYLVPKLVREIAGEASKTPVEHDVIPMAF